jgi:hypothetical protein
MWEASANAVADAVRNKTCEWSDDGEYYNTQCGGAFHIESGTPADNGMEYCAYCGGKLIDVTVTE